MSRLFDLTRQHRSWSVLDLDGSYAAGPMWVQREVRRRLARQSAIIFSTARTPELVMSASSYALSHAYGTFTRPKPHWYRMDDHHDRIGEHQLHRFDHQVDPDAIFAFGQGIYLQSKQGYYCTDESYEEHYLRQDLWSPESLGVSWRQLMLAAVHRIGAERFLSDVDREGTYAKQECNVAALDYRIQLNFSGPGAVEQKFKVLKAVRELCREGPLKGRFIGVDESKPNIERPELSRSTLYLVPREASKEDMLNRALIQTCNRAQVPTREMDVLIAGDTLTDLYQCCYAGWDARVVGIIVGGSALGARIAEKAGFAGEDLHEYHASLEPIEGKPGWHTFNNSNVHGGRRDAGSKRIIILGDQAYPGKIGAETILAYLNERDAPH